MKITNATWEKRNFGMDTYEISIEKKDMRDYQEVLKKIDEQNFHKAYVVIKMPTGNLKLLHALEDSGYRFLETQLSLVNHFEPIESEVNMFAQDVKNDCTVEIVPKKKEDWNKVINKITPGMFDTDRVSLDPALGQEVACKRYQNWCRDLFDNPTSEMCVHKISSDIYGFSISVKDEKTGVIDYVLGGMFEEYKDMGFGTSWINSGASNIKAKTAVSTNNVPVIKLHQHSGKVIYKLRYVLRKIYE